MGLVAVPFCGQCTVLSTVLETFWKRVVIREGGHFLPHVVGKKERNCTSASPIRLYGVLRDVFNTIQIGSVTD